MNEIWKPVPGYEGFLEASSEGRVRALPSVREGIREGVRNVQRRKGCIYRPFTGKHGYFQIAPKFGDKRKKLLVHRLVASSFVPGFFDGASVNHIDGDKKNNRAANLEWMTLAENTSHQWRTGLVNLRGENHPSAKLSDADVAEIRKRLSAGERTVLIARHFKVSNTLIYKIRAGQKRIHS